jgi:hypothetical protein
MRTRLAVGTLIAVGALLWVRASSGQVQPAPAFGTGVVTVTGTVDIGSASVVNAVQRGEWKVTVDNMPTVTLAPLPFVKLGRTYRIIWASGQTQTIAVRQIGPHGWVATDAAQRSWVNLAGAQSVEETN